MRSVGGNCKERFPPLGKRLQGVVIGSVIGNGGALLQVLFQHCPSSPIFKRLHLGVVIVSRLDLSVVVLHKYKEMCHKGKSITTNCAVALAHDPTLINRAKL